MVFKMRDLGGVLAVDAFAVFRRTGDPKRPFVFFGFEKDAMSVYPTRARALKAAKEAAILRGHEWEVCLAGVGFPTREQPPEPS